MNDNYLIHYGVLGMKWGVRKDRQSSMIGLYGKKSTQESLAKDLKDKNYSRIKETHTFKNDSACLDKHHYTNIVNKSTRVYNKASEILASDSFKKSIKHIYIKNME